MLVQAITFWRVANERLVFHFLPLRGTGFSHRAALVVTIDNMLRELEELLHYLLINLQGISALRELPLCPRDLRHLVVHIFLALTIESGVGITACHAM